jgi:NhaA family Na+:H+ antiporter
MKGVLGDMGKSIDFKAFFSSEASSGIVTFSCVILSLIVANTALAGPLQALLDTPIGISSEALHLKYPLQIWINDGLMAIFFLMVGLEIKREMIEGELSTPKKALLPVLCAIGGAVVPAMVYTLLNSGHPTSVGWGISMATDIAFALAIISMLSKRVPASLKIFLAALAIVDDLMAILVIALFYSGDMHLNYLLYAAGIAVLLFVLNRMKITNLIFYLVPGMFLWYFVHHSGVHATIAGVITAMAVPTGDAHHESPLQRLEHSLVKPVNFLIIPIFAFSNTNITFESGMIDGLLTPLGLGIVLGLFLGKPVGVMIVSFIAVRSGLCQLPDKANWRHILGVGLLAGIGFTMSIFMAILSFTDGHLIASAKFSILCGSLLSAVSGFLVLKSRAAE